MGFSSSVAKVWSAFKELIFCQVLLAIVFLTSGLVVDLIQFVLYTTIRPFNPVLYRKVNYYVTYTLNSQIVFLVEWWSQSRLQLYIDPDDLKKNFGKEHAILIMNHTYEIDWVMGWLVCDRVGVLGNARVYVKKILLCAPVLGWSWKFQEIVFLERDWEKDRRSLGHQLNNLVNYPDPMWLTLFPEGTRFTKQKHEASMEVARAKGLPELTHHLLPRTRGFVASIPHLREKVPALYDVVIAVDPRCQNEPSMYSILKGRPVLSKIMIRRFPIEEVPQGDEECAQWLHERYQEKDQLLDNFIRTGEFLPSSSPLSKKPEFQNYLWTELPRRKYSILNFSTWSILILVPLLSYLLSVLTSGNYVKMAIVVGLILAANMGLMKLIDLTRISKGSSYGYQAPGGGGDGGDSSEMGGGEGDSSASVASASSAKQNGKSTVSNGVTNGKATKVH